MTDPDTPTDGIERGSVEELLLAGIGWASLTADAVDELADDLARRVGVEPEKMRAAVRDTAASWRKEIESGTGKRTDAADRLIVKLGLARRDEVEDLALTVAQLDHRLRLLERPTDD